MHVNAIGIYIRQVNYGFENISYTNKYGFLKILVMRKNIFDKIFMQ